jgi:hypothetical protein
MTPIFLWISPDVPHPRAVPPCRETCHHGTVPRKAVGQGAIAHAGVHLIMKVSIPRFNAEHQPAGRFSHKSLWLSQ